MSRGFPSYGPHQAHPGQDEPADDTGCTILHVDMDAFYASVELRERPELRGTPVIVGATGGRGVVLSATYEARQLGVHSAMPMSRARRLAPQATVIPPRHDRYAEVSAAVMALLRSLTPLVEPLASDEAFLDVSGARRRLGRPVEISQLIRDRVADEQGITCSVGIATTKFVAKLATTLAKPDGLLVVPVDDTIAFLHPLPVAALWGVGEATAQVLSRLGLHTVGDVAATSRATLQRVLGRTAGAHVHDLAWGRDERPVVPHEPDRSIGAERTFDRDVDDPVLVRRQLLALAERTAARARRRGLAGRTVTIKVRFADFTTLTRSRTLPDATDVARELYLAAVGLYDGLHLQRARIRLVGVRLEGLTDIATAPRQLALTERDSGWREAEQAADRASARFGVGAIRRASLVAGGDTAPSPPGPPGPPGQPPRGRE